MPIDNSKVIDIREPNIGKQYTLTERFEELSEEWKRKTLEHNIALDQLAQRRESILLQIASCTNEDYRKALQLEVDRIDSEIRSINSQIQAEFQQSQFNPLPFSSIIQ